ncbi:uncharacterized protein At1g08160-like [Beta vulgaris subsp. vulgaris]|uniref:uncharacterized protein At1g08160-like n=1 Tax=Beta vulgaris subsp. vulgaris TaxID=3555 RepID=UPI0020373548|nr:uncharacterized protein At1g08160-like [Beta vulgaris subsp. vulgaris]
MVNRTCVIIIIVNIILLGGGAIFIAWYSDHMEFPSFSVEQGAINAYNFTAKNHLDATFIFVVRSHNRDPKYDIEYKQVVVSVYHPNGYSLTYENESPYIEHHGNGSFFTAHAVAHDVLVSDADVAADLRNGTVSGHLDVEVRVRAKVRYEVKRWKHKNYLLKAICSPVVLNFTTWKTFNKTYCNVDSFDKPANKIDSFQT